MRSQDFISSGSVNILIPQESCFCHITLTQKTKALNLDIPVGGRLRGCNVPVWGFNRGQGLFPLALTDTPGWLWTLSLCHSYFVSYCGPLLPLLVTTHIAGLFQEGPYSDPKPCSVWCMSFEVHMASFRYCNHNVFLYKSIKIECFKCSEMEQIYVQNNNMRAVFTVSLSCALHLKH